MLFLKVNFETKETIFESFTLIAEKFSKDFKLKFNNNFYRITDFEFYSYSQALPDPYTHKDKIQLQNGKLYLHSSGVDITFGDTINYGGILLRGIIKMYDGALPEAGLMKQQFNGPQIVASELFSNLFPLDSIEKNEILLIEDEKTEKKFCLPYKILKTTRIGLKMIPADPEEFYKNLALRYIIVLPKFPAFKQNINGIENIMRDHIKKSQISHNEVLDILGYKLKF